MAEPRPVTIGEHTIDVLAFRQGLISWGQEHYRSFLWRKTEDPYRILMADVMLHRTQALQVVPVYEHFIRVYPNAASLARTSTEDLHTLLFPLGLRWRVDLVYKMAAEIADRFDGQVPKDRDELLSLPGVSDYIASAVRCFSWNLPEPLIDTNTVRVVGRLFGLKIKDSSRRNRRFRELITALVDPKHPRTYNYALLDLAHLICHKRKAPECTRCPVQAYCVYGTERPRSDKQAENTAIRER
jgi:A/G-specific adenine glycosylase